MQEPAAPCGGFGYDAFFTRFIVALHCYAGVVGYPSMTIHGNLGRTDGGRFGEFGWGGNLGRI